MKFNKFVITVAALFALTFATQAGLGTPSKVFNTTGLSIAVAGCTNSLATGATVTNTFDCSAGKELGLQVDLAATGASTSNTTFTVYKSINGTTFDPAAILTFTVAAAGTAVQTLTTNVTINSVQKIRITTSTACISSAPLTNSTIVAVVK